MKSPSTKNRVFFVLAAAALLLLAVGCSKSPLESTEPTQETKVLGRSASSLAAALLSPGDGSGLYVDQVISAETGGRLEFFDVIIEVPAGAIDNDTTFSILIPDLSVFYNEFGTNGLVFNVPVKVTMSYRDADLTGVVEESIRIAYFNNVTGEFEDIVCQLDTVNKVVKAELHHFSAYGLISDYVFNPFK
jgi:hypothetical protein